MILGSDDPLARELSLSETNSRLPRKVRLYADERPKLLIVAVAVLAAVAIWFGSYRHYIAQTQQQELLQTQGRELTAQTIKLLSSKGGAYVRYTFRVESVWYQGEAKLPDHPRIDASVGRPILIRYLPSDPSVNHPRAWEWSLGWDIVPILWMLLLTGSGFTAAIVTAATLLRERALMRKGWVVEGRVTGCSPNRTKFSVYYEFHTEDSMVVEGAKDSSDAEYEVGSHIRVIYLRHRPKTNDFYPLSSFRVVE